MLNERAMNLMLYAKGRYPASENKLRDVAVIVGRYAGVSPDDYSPELVAKIVVEDLGPLVQKTCNQVQFAELLLRLGPGNPLGLVEELGFSAALVHGLLGAISLGTTTTRLAEEGVVLGEPDADLANILAGQVAFSS